jgi:hypothetical protein
MKIRKNFLWFCLCLLTFYSYGGYAMDKNYAEEEFEQAWNNPKYTQIKLDDVDINETLSKYYELSTPIHFTRQMLWDVEIKKAWDPKTYISYVVRDGKSWGREILENGDVVFVRSSQQKQWLNPEKYGEVFEKVFLNHKEQIATFIGTNILKDEIGNDIDLENDQFLFHVQHSVGGDEENPVNIWRIVHLTEKKDQQIIDFFQTQNDTTELPGFVEIYIEKDLHTSISHK